MYKYSHGTDFYRKDAQGNIIALLDSSGSVVVQYVYDAWGNHAVLDANGADIADASHIGNRNPFRYRGYYYDTETELYYLQTRYYDPETGRFITIDGIEYLDPETINGLNLYAYCGNNPVMNVDPTGTLKWWQWLLGIVAVVAIVGVVVASAIVTGGASLAAIGLGFTIGATASFVGQGVGNLLGGRNFFDGMSVSSILLGGLAGAAYATGMGGALGALGIGVAAGVASSSFQGKSLKEIVWSGFVSGASAAIAYGIGQTFKNLIFKNTDSEFIDFFEMAKVDGANVFKAFTTAFNSSWYTFLPSMSTGLSRFIFNWLGTRGLKNA